MSSAFLKNETADVPVVIPARAPLPPGTPNYVTRQGLTLLRLELTELETQRARWQAATIDDENERSRQLALLTGCIGQLNQRFSIVKVVDPQDQNRVRFGARVRLVTQTGPLVDMEAEYTIVGVDQAKAAQGLIAFTAPLSHALQEKQVGETVFLRTQQGQQNLKIRYITYDVA